MKIKVTSLVWISILLIAVYTISCSPGDSEKETMVQIPQTVSEVPKITVDELLQHFENDDDIVIVDVRDEEEYVQAHIKGAISVPLPVIDTQEWEPPRDKAVVLY